MQDIEEFVVFPFETKKENIATRLEWKHDYLQTNP